MTIMELPIRGPVSERKKWRLHPGVGRQTSALWETYRPDGLRRRVELKIVGLPTQEWTRTEALDGFYTCRDLDHTHTRVPGGYTPVTGVGRRGSGRTGRYEKYVSRLTFRQYFYNRVLITIDDPADPWGLNEKKSFIDPDTSGTNGARPSVTTRFKTVKKAGGQLKYASIIS